MQCNCNANPWANMELQPRRPVPSAARVLLQATRMLQNGFMLKFLDVLPYT